MSLKVKEVADLVGISVRTLHHYDEIGLLHPAQITEAGYRQYSDDDLEVLQQILFFKELGFPLKKIKKIVHSQSFERNEALQMQRKMLINKQKRLENMIQLIDKTIEHSKGEINMTNKEKFEGFDFSSNPYEKEARERWGDKAVDESNAKVNNLTKYQQKALSDEMNAIYQRLATLKDTNTPNSDEVQQVIKQWFDFLNNNFSTYSYEAFKGLGLMYEEDRRFTKNIDKFGQGLAKFMSDSMVIFADENKE